MRGAESDAAKNAILIILLTKSVSMIKSNQFNKCENTIAQRFKAPEINSLRLVELLPNTRGRAGLSLGNLTCLGVKAGAGLFLSITPALDNAPGANAAFTGLPTRLSGSNNRESLKTSGRLFGDFLTAVWLAVMFSLPGALGWYSLRAYSSHERGAHLVRKEMIIKAQQTCNGFAVSTTL